MSAPYVLEMIWRDVCFAHWRADANTLRRLLPSGVMLDTYDGDGWLSVVPFRLTRVHLRFAPVLPGFSEIPEINLRTYVRVGDVPGIWFFSLDADSALAVRSARITTSLPYLDARITTSENAGEITYCSERTARKQIAGRFAARYRAPASEQSALPGSREFFLHERYTFFNRRGSQLVAGRIEHAPWSVGAIEIDISDNTLGDLIAHPLQGGPDFVYFARERAVRAAPIRVVTPR